MCAAPIADNDVVFWKIRHSSRSQDVNSDAELKQLLHNTKCGIK